MSLRRLIRSLASPAPAPGGFQFILGPGGVPRLRDPNGLVYRLRAEAGTAENAPATALLDPAGANNGIALEGDFSDAAIVIDSTTDRTQLTAADVDGGITVTSGDKRRMIVTADFGEGLESLILDYRGIQSGNPRWSDVPIPSGPSATPFYSAWIFSGDMYLNRVVNAVTTGGFIISSASGFPDEQDWSTATTDGAATLTPTPVVTAAAATAAQAIAALNTITGLTASNASGSDGTGAIAAATANFTPGAAITPGQPGDLLYDDSNLYLLTSTGWKTIPIP